MAVKNKTYQNRYCTCMSKHVLWQIKLLNMYIEPRAAVDDVSGTAVTILCIDYTIRYVSVFSLERHYQTGSLSGRFRSCPGKGEVFAGRSVQLLTSR